MQAKQKRNASSKGQTSLHFGTVKSVNEATVRAVVTLEDLGIDTYELSILQPRTSLDQAVDQLDVGDRVAVLLDEKGEQGVILGAIYTDSNPPPAIASRDIYFRRFQDGTEISYDRSTSKLDINCVGEVTVVGTRIDLNP